MRLPRHQRFRLSRLRLSALARGAVAHTQVFAGNLHCRNLRLVSRIFFLVVLCVLCGFNSLKHQDDKSTSTGDFLLIRRGSPQAVQQIRLAAINEQFVEHLPVDKNWERVPLSECIALVNPAAKIKPRTTGVLILTDGQRFPGEAVTTVPSIAETLGWNHPWLGRMDVPLKQIDSVLLTSTAIAPAPGNEDVVLLTNGDRQEGLIVALGSSISLEVGRGAKAQTVDIPLNLVAAITMIAGKQQPTGKRIWFDDGTAIDVQSITVGDDGYVRLAGIRLVSGTQPSRVSLSQIAAILLDPRGMIPLATLSPSRVEGPASRYILPKPVVADPDAPLNLSSIEFHGPLVARYALPPSVQRFSAQAQLPRDSQQWGDYELIVRSNDSEVFRTRLNAANPIATIDVALNGRELTIEITEGGNGPIQDRLLLVRPILLMKSST